VVPPKSSQLAGAATPIGEVRHRVDVRQTYEPEGEGTRINVVMEGEPGGFFKLAEPLVERAIRREMETNFATLKDVLESQSS
jgi:carbon monoxide dehydrogenase subunit G